jgi:hypothetical protein
VKLTKKNTRGSKRKSRLAALFAKARQEWPKMFLVIVTGVLTTVANQSISNLWQPALSSVASAVGQSERVKNTEIATIFGVEAAKRFGAGDAIGGHILYYQAAIRWRDLADSSNDSNAWFQLGKLACLGWGIEKNEDLAREAFMQAKLSPMRRQYLLQRAKFKRCLLPQPPQAASAAT